MPIYTWRTSSYARDIYIFGNRTLNDVPEGYVIPIEQYAAATFSQEQIDNALANAWITQAEYDATIAYITE